MRLIQPDEATYHDRVCVCWMRKNTRGHRLYQSSLDLHKVTELWYTLIAKLKATTGKSTTRDAKSEPGTVEAR